MLVNDEVYTQLTPDKVHAVVQGYKVKAERPALSWHRSVCDEWGR